MGKRSTERSSACITCGKTFARSDTLLRHKKSHHTTEDRGPVHRVTNGTFRACCACAQARSRCSGGLPCGRCKTRSLECAYPNKRRKGTTSDGQGQSSFSMSDLPSNHQNESVKVQQQYPGQFQQFVFSPTSNSPYPGTGLSELGRVNSASELPRVEQMQLRPHQPERVHHGLASELPLGDANERQVSSTENNLQGITSDLHQMSSTQPYTSTTAAVNYQTEFQDQHATFDGNNLYDESYNLNWIPLSIYPSPYGDMDQDFSFLLPPLSDTASMSNGFDPLVLNTLPSTARSNDIGAAHSSSTYRPPASISGLMQSPASTGSDNATPAWFSFDSVEVSETKKKRRKSSHITAGFSQTKQAQNEFSFPDMSMLSSAAKIPKCSEARWSQISATFHQLCINSSRWKPFSSANFPAPSSLNACVDLYFEHQHSTFPLIHAPTFEQNGSWLSCLATAAIGSTFAAIPNCADAREAFQEFLRRAVLATTDEHDNEFRNIHLAQARILALVGLAQSDREQLRSRTPRAHADVARWCLESSILQLTEPDEEVRSDEDIAAAWYRWIQRESLRRVGYFIWFLDCALGYIGNARPLCNIDDARAPLPCSESLWNALSAQEWLMHRNNTPRMPSLCAALETMYNKKTIDPGLSEISHILLIHALYSRTWEVGTHIKQPLSEWKATGNATGFLNTPSKDNFWLPLYPLYANWRNSACDCLDVLHWQATATMARHSGAEHHGVLHLHLARVILLTPFQEIQDLLFFLINHRVSDLSKASFYVHDGSYQPRNPAKLPQIRKITWRWLREDQHKARLAMIHAGSVFWHVRRYSTSSFFEPLAVYLASIVLWTYGSYKSAALERDAAAGHNSNGNGSIDAKHHQNLDDRFEHTQIEPGNDFNVQPTRVERAAQDYAELKSNSSRSRSVQNTGTSSANSPGQARNHLGTNTASKVQTLSKTSPIALTTNDDYKHVDPAISESPLSVSVSASQKSSDEEEEDDEDDQPTFIHLDRPCDDEIVQHFVRNGHNMSGYMSNVGDICKTPQKVLLEGAKILRTRLACWGISREFHDILVRLAEMRKDSKEKGKGREKGKGNGAGKEKGREDGRNGEDAELG